MAALKKRSGAPDTKYYDQSDTIGLFEPIRLWLLQNYDQYTQADPPSNKALATLTCTLLQFQDDVFGQHSKNRPLTKLPIKLFHDFSEGGALCHILATAYQVKSEQSWRRFDFHQPTRMDRNMELFMMIHRNLLQHNLWTPPMVYFDASVEAELIKQLSDIVKAHSGILVQDRKAASHVIYPKPPPPSNPDEEYFTPLAQKGKQALIHWIYYPDSYDCWVPASEVGVAPEPATDPPKQWLVNANWLLDCEKFNEWMNEIDYQVIVSSGSSCDFQHTAPYLEATGRKCIKGPEVTSRKRQRSPSPVPGARKRKRNTVRRKIKDDDVDFEEENLPSAPPTQPHVEPAAPNEDIQPTGHVIQLETMETSSCDVPDDTPTEPVQQTAPPITEQTTTTQQATSTTQQATPIAQQATPTTQQATPTTQPVAVNDDDLHKEHLVTPQAHHVIIPSYSSWFDYNGVHAIEKQAVPEFFSAQNRSKSPEIYMAYRNFMIDTYRLNPMEYLTVTACRRNLTGDVCAILRVHGLLEQWGLINYQVDTQPHTMGPPPTSHFHLMADTPTGVQPLPFKGIQMLGQAPSQQLLNMSNSDGNKEPSSSVEGDVSNLGLKADQYLPKSPEVKPWSEQETLKLLEGMELYRDDWNKVAEHVSSRSQDECVLHFLKLPIQDPYLDENSELGPLQYQPVPFSQSGNPIMSTVAFLASVVDPRVAAAAAKAALQEYTNMKDELPSNYKQQAGEGDQDKSKDKKDDDATPTKEEDTPTSEGLVKTAAAAALVSAAVKAKHLATVEERKIKSLVALLVETQMKKLEIKLKHFEELEAIVDQERMALEMQRQRLLSDRQQFQREQMKLLELRSPTTLTPQTPLPLTPSARQFVVPTTKPAPPPNDTTKDTASTVAVEEGVAKDDTKDEVADSSGNDNVPSGSNSLDNITPQLQEGVAPNVDVLTAAESGGGAELLPPVDDNINTTSDDLFPIDFPNSDHHQSPGNEDHMITEGNEEVAIQQSVEFESTNQISADIAGSPDPTAFDDFDNIGQFDQSETLPEVNQSDQLGKLAEQLDQLPQQPIAMDDNNRQTDDISVQQLEELPTDTS